MVSSVYRIEVQTDQGAAHVVRCLPFARQPIPENWTTHSKAYVLGELPDHWAICKRLHFHISNIYKIRIQDYYRCLFMLVLTFGIIHYQLLFKHQFQEPFRSGLKTYKTLRFYNHPIHQRPTLQKSSDLSDSLYFNRTFWFHFKTTSYQ